MRIQHNIAAMNSYRQLGGNNNALSKNLEKLSSGYRINRAGDDAAGLAISEKMRAQIKGLEAAQKNANDAISLVQTAEGALTEVHSMLNRMTYLATQSANGTYEDGVDRANLQAEVDSLLEEIDRISKSTNFNSINLLDGSLGGPKVTSEVGTAASTEGAVKAEFTVDMSAVVIADSEDFIIGTGADKITVAGDSTTAAGAAGSLAAIKTALNGKEVTLDSVVFTAAVADDGKVTFTQKTAADYTVTPATLAAEITNNGTGVAASTVTKVADGDAGTTTPATATTASIDFTGLTGADMIGGKVTVAGTEYEFVDAATATATGNQIAVNATDDGEALAEALADKIGGTSGAFTVDNNGTAVEFEETTPAGGTAAPTIAVVAGGKTMQVGDTADGFNKVTVKIEDMSTTGLGINGLKIDNQVAASDAIKKIKDAINTVSSTRGDLGAVQNRLEHTINNLGVTTENITAAESRIRDTDMADEMMAYTKNNILVQAAQAMLAQANQVPQGVLQLLQ